MTAGTLVPVQAGTQARVCDCNVGDFCGHRAVEAIHFRFPGGGWEHSNRCPGHPAREYERYLLSLVPAPETRIERLGVAR